MARALLDRKIDYFTAYVCENLGSPDECVTQGELTELANIEFGPLNVMILLRKPNLPDRPVQMIGRRFCLGIRTRSSCNRSPNAGC